MIKSDKKHAKCFATSIFLMGPKKESNKKQKKRTKSVTSPDSLSCLPNEKRQNTTVMTSGSQNDQLSQMSQSLISPNSNMMHQPFAHFSPRYQASQTANQTAYQNTQYMNPIHSTPQMNNQINWNKIIIDKLEVMDKRLAKLDWIENQVMKINEKVSAMDVRITSLETNLKTSNDRLLDLEASR